VWRKDCWLLEVIIVFVFFSQIVSGNERQVRQPRFSGLFYPSRAEELRQMVNSFLDKASPAKVEGQLSGIIVPHAGYIYSGATAGLAYSLLRGRKIGTVILLGQSHRARFTGAIIDDRDAWKTPLGSINLNKELFSRLYKKSCFHVNRFWMDEEHSLEVQVPFLQVVAETSKIFPILVGDAEADNIKKIAAELNEVIGNRQDTIIVISTDMSHYHPLEVATKIDWVCLRLLENRDIKGLREQLEKRQVELCGEAAVLTLLSLLSSRENWNIQVLGYSTSAQASGDKSRVVGYGALAVTVESKKKSGGEAMLNEQQRKKLLQLARETILCHLRGEKLPSVETDDARLKEKRGVFVTLKKNDNLRGCIGLIIPVTPLMEAVQKMAIESATGDPRFPPVTISEMKEIKIEISVLTVPRRVNSAEDIVLGRDGVIVKRGFRQGVFLPQVAEETGWNKEQFLSNLCAHKAGLPARAWEEKETELYTFQAEVFSE